jgi:hypothetical protein
MKNTLLFATCFFIAILASANNQEQDAIIECYDVETIPTINGKADDTSWELAKWQAIDQTWIPWGQELAADDFTGRYKTVWSSETNLMYFLVEITDDVISDAYVLGETSDIFNFDMIEVFIDQDQSGGDHIFDTDDTNAENAFAYHIFSKQPESGSVTTDYYVTDIAGTSWADRQDPSYVDHLPEFALGRIDKVSTYEFSFIVYNDTYSESNKEAARVTLQKDTQMGLSLAANDDDEPEIDPSQTERDNMIGSVAVTEANNNDHWELADDFGTVKLLSDKTSIESLSNKELKVYPNPANELIVVEILKEASTIELFSITGQLVKTIQSKEGNTKVTTQISDLEEGIYTIKIASTKRTIQKKIIIH